MSGALLELSGVGISFGALQAVNGVSLKLGAGERVAIFGPNGAGKTTLFNAITGMTPATHGTIKMQGIDITRASPHKRAAYGLARTFQITNLFFGLSVEENLLLATRGLRSSKFSLFGLGGPTLSEKETVESAMQRCHLLARRSVLVKQLAYGEQRQLELAMSLTSSPKVLLLDEPAAGLSAVERKVMAEVIKGLSREMSFILIEHDIELALSLVERVICMYQGQIFAQGSPDEIRANEGVQDIYLGRRRRA
jgi:branched-chain amino acid transport system ATP-binding protein